MSKSIFLGILLIGVWIAAEQLQAQSIVLTSGVGTNNQQVCINTPIVNIVYLISNVANQDQITLPQNLPQGVSISLIVAPPNNVRKQNKDEEDEEDPMNFTATVSGTPSVAGEFEYIIQVSGNNGGFSEESSAIGTITIFPNASSGTVSSAVSALCIGSATTFSANNFITGGPGGSGIWTSSEPDVASVDSSTGVATGLSSGSTNIIYTVSGGCGPEVSESAPLTIHPDAAVVSVGGPSSMCINQTEVFQTNGVVFGGNGTGQWSSSNASVAQVNASGLVTALAHGQTNITYTVTGGCGGAQSASLLLTVHPNASINSVNGPDFLCINQSAGFNASAVNLGGSGTGAWSSSNMGVATINNTGQVNTLSAGTTNIIYTITGGCGGTVSANKSLTVRPDATIGSVTGSESLCIGETETFNANGVVTGGGTGLWSSSNENILTVSSTGTVTTLSDGTANVIYTINGGCNATPVAQQQVVVYPDASLSSLNGTSPMCIGEIAIYQPVGLNLGGTGTANWSSSDPGVAIVDQSGQVSTLSAGTTQIILSVEGGCNNTPTAQQTLLVYPDAAIESVTGESPVCIGQIIPYQATEVVLGGTGTGTWSSSDINVATIDQNGMVSALSSGFSMIAYTITGGCGGTVFREKELAVSPLPVASAGGQATLCANESHRVSGATALYGTIQWTHDGGGTLTDAQSITPRYNAVRADASKTITLTLTVISDNECGYDATATASYQLTVRPIPEEFSITGEATVCANSRNRIYQTNISNTASYTYLWEVSSNGDFEETNNQPVAHISWNTPGFTNLTLNVYLGNCVLSEAYPVNVRTEAAPTPDQIIPKWDREAAFHDDFPPIVLIYSNETEDDLQYQWLADGIPVQGAVEQYFYRGEGLYIMPEVSYDVRVVKIYSNLQCYNYSAAPYRFDALKTIPDTTSFALIYPNPATTLLNISISETFEIGNSEANFRIIDLHGKTVSKGVLSQHSNTVDVSRLSKGFYIINIYTNEKQESFKIIKD